MKTGITVIDKYAAFHGKRMRLMGFEIEPQEVTSELSLVYTKALTTYNPNNQTGAEFETYVIRAFELRVRRMIKGMIANSAACVSIEQVEGILFDNMGDDIDSSIVSKQLKSAVFRAIGKGVRLVIFKEMVDPSSKVCDMVFALKPHKRHVRNPIIRAISLVYGLKYNTVKDHVYHIRNIAKNVDKHN